MKASVDGHIIAQSDDIVACHGYQYFPQNAVRMDWLQKTEKTAERPCLPAWRAILRRGRRWQAP